MGEQFQSFSISDYLAQTFVYTSLYTVTLLIFTSPVIYILLDAGMRVASYAVVGVIGFSLLISQEFIKSGIGENTENPDSLLAGVLMFAAGLAYYNIIVFLAAFTAEVASLAITPTLGIPLAVIYPLWELKTGQKAVPLSFTGIIVLVALGLVMVGILGKAVFDLFREIEYQPLRIIDPRRFSRRGNL